MVRGTTPTYILKLKSKCETEDPIDLSIADDIYVTFSNKQYQILLTKSGEDLTVEDNTVEVFLTQEETLSIPRGEFYIQVNWTYDDSGIKKRACSVIKEISSKRNLINEVI